MRPSPSNFVNSAIDKLSKVLQLEAARGYDNRAVFGGLERMMESWEPEVLASGISAELPQLVISRLKDYPRLSPAGRAELLNGVWMQLADEYPELRDRIPGAGAAPEAAEPEPEEIEAEEPVQPEASVEDPGLVEPASLDTPLTSVAGIGPKSGKTLQKLGLETLEDLFWHLPRRYDDYSQLKTINRLWYGEEVTIIGTVEQVSVRTVRGGKLQLVEARIGDGTGSIGVTWFNQAWIASRLKPGEALVLSGRVEEYLGKLTMNVPEWEPLEAEQIHTNRIVPVYPLTAGITAKY